MSPENKGFPRINMHNHTVFSDGSYKAIEIVHMAEEGCSLDVVGICDHYQTEKVWDYSIPFQNIPEYIEHIRKVGDMKRTAIRVLCGLEIDFSPRSPGFRERLTADFLDTLNQVDFLLFEYVNSEIWEGFPLAKLLEVRPQLEIPVGIAHCEFQRDLWSGEQDNRILFDLADASIFLELAPGSRNRAFTPVGPLPYYRLAEGLFIEVRENNIPLKFSIGTDTHSDLSQVCDITDAEEFLDEYRLLDHVIQF
ncbi:MAG: PHP domain-containing protein [Candidatus Thorarchaeota archaeon]